MSNRLCASAPAGRAQARKLHIAKSFPGCLRPFAVQVAHAAVPIHKGFGRGRGSASACIWRRPPERVVVSHVLALGGILRIMCAAFGPNSSSRSLLLASCSVNRRDRAGGAGCSAPHRRRNPTVKGATCVLRSPELQPDRSSWFCAFMGGLRYYTFSCMFEDGHSIQHFVLMPCLARASPSPLAVRLV